MKVYVIAISALLWLSGCASSEFSPAGDATASSNDAQVQVLEHMPAPGSYRMLGVIIVRGVNLSSDERMFDELKERAAAQGADAVVPQAPIRDTETTDGSAKRTLAAWAIRRN